MANTNGHRVAVVGGGLAGALMAIYLARAGFDATVFEKLPDPRAHGFSGGRSINLALSARGIAALREVGLADEILRDVIPMPGRMIHALDGTQTFLPYSSDPHDRINSVSRAGLSIALLEAAARHPNVKLLFEHRCMEIDFSKPSITFDPGGGRTATYETDFVIGADGAYSAVRLQMMLHMDRFAYRQDFLEHGYKELTIPPAQGAFAMQPNALHIWPRGGYMMIALPNQDRSFTCTCFWPYRGPHGFESLRSDDEIRKYFEAHFSDAVPLMPTLVEDFKRNPIGSLVTVHCKPWHLRDKAALIGDAAHAIVPFYGQGMNCAFEDCSALNRCLKQFAPDWQKAFEEYEAMRRKHADAIAEMAVDNFIEMRDKTASRLFRARKHFEHALHRVFPRWYLPLYNMISFTTIPYAEARRRARRQWGIVTGIIAAIGLIVAAMAAFVVKS